MTIEIGASDLDFFFQLAAINPNTSLWNGHVITYSDGPAIAEAIESRIQAFFLTDDPDSASYLQAAAYFAHKGSSEEDRDLIEKDIIELLNTPEGLLARGQEVLSFLPVCVNLLGSFAKNILKRFLLEWLL